MSEEKTPAVSSFKFEVGKEIDSALGEVIRGLLKRPAEEAGSLLANGVGIIGDRIKRKRELNAQLALEDTRKILDARKVDLLDITPPEEEELHAVLTGMSLAGDEKIRELWASLLATALDPATSQHIERPVVSVLEALSPTDARVIKVAAYVIRENTRIQMEAEEMAGVSRRGRRSLGEFTRIKKIRDEELAGQVATFVSSVQRMREDYDIADIAANPEWADNLIRLGLIKPREIFRGVESLPQLNRRSVDINVITEVVQHFSKELQRYEKMSTAPKDVPFAVLVDEAHKEVALGFEFTRFGEKFCNACGLL